MATKYDEFKVYYFSFTDDELETIVKALIEAGEDDLAAEISDDADLWPDDIDDGVEVATLKFDIDTSDITEARKELAGLVEAARGLQDVIEKLQIGNVKFRGEWFSDIVGAIANEAYKDSGIKIEAAR